MKNNLKAKKIKEYAIITRNKEKRMIKYRSIQLEYLKKCKYDV